MSRSEGPDDRFKKWIIGFHTPTGLGADFWVNSGRGRFLEGIEFSRKVFVMRIWPRHFRKNLIFHLGPLYSGEVWKKMNEGAGHLLGAFRPCPDLCVHSTASITGMIFVLQP